MKVLLAPQEFKGSMTARQAAASMARGVRRAARDAEVDELPLSDGGSGLVDALVAADGGALRSVRVSDPLGRPVEAAFGIVEAGRTAVIELAAASGLSLLRRAELDPLRTSTYGTGEVIRAALDLGLREFIVGIGGSATNDGGAGIAEALGARLLDREGLPIPRGGGGLRQLARIDVSGLDPRVRESRFLVASDVRNPLHGPAGASAVYGPQKGATPEMVRELDLALAHFGSVVARDLGVDVSAVEGAGAAGGTGAGLLAFLNAELRPGFELVAAATRLEERLRRADLTLTGEGRLDEQTAFGKGVGRLAALASDCNVPIVALAGELGAGYERTLAAGLTAAVSIAPGPIDAEDAIERGPELLATAAEALMRVFAAGAAAALDEREPA